MSKFKHNTSPVGLAEKYDGLEVDVLLRQLENMRYYRSIAEALSQYVGLLFFRYVATEDQQVFQGVDVAGRTMRVPGPLPKNPQVFVDSQMIPAHLYQVDHVEDGEGEYTTKVTFHEPQELGARVWVSAYGINKEDNTFYFDDIWSREYVTVMYEVLQELTSKRIGSGSVATDTAGKATLTLDVMDQRTGEVLPELAIKVALGHFMAAVTSHGVNVHSGPRTLNFEGAEVTTVGNEVTVLIPEPPVPFELVSGTVLEDNVTLRAVLKNGEDETKTVDIELPEFMLVSTMIEMDNLAEELKDKFIQTELNASLAIAAKVDALLAMNSALESRNLAMAAHNEAVLAMEEANAAARFAVENADASALSAVSSETARGHAKASEILAVLARDEAEGFAATAVEQTSLIAEFADEAAGHALAANSSVSVAIVKANEAEISAIAANSERLLAETAKGSAVVARDEAVSAKEDAEGHSAIASVQAGLAVTSATDAENFANAAATSATTASTKATEAGTTAEVAESHMLAAETAKGLAVIAKDEAVYAQESAEGHAATATTQAALSVSSVGSAASYATAANTSASTAATKATEAEASAEAANTAKLSAESAKGGAESARTDAVTARNTAQGHAATATTQANLSATSLSEVQRALNAASPMISIRPILAAAHLGTSSAGSPSDFAPLTASYFGSDEHGAYAYRTTDLTVRALTTRALVPAGDGRVYRVRAKVRVNGNGVVMRLIARLIGADYNVTDSTAVATSALTEANGVVTIEATFGRQSGGLVTNTLSNASIWNAAVGLRFSVDNSNAVAGAAFHLYELDVTDLTSADAAARSATAASGSATAANNSASTATTKANEAGASATAANTAKLAAETAQTQAGLRRDEAVTAKNDAQGAASSASTSMELAARVASQGIGVLVDQFLKDGTNAWTTYITAPTYQTNSVYPQGRQAKFTVPADTNAGLQVTSTYAGWVGEKQADAYVVEFEFILHSGSTAGAGARVHFINTASTTFGVSESLANMVQGPIIAGRVTTARAVLRRPTNFTGTPDRTVAYVMVSHSGFSGTRPARDMTILRANVRVASAEEQGLGAVEATISQKYMTAAQAETALSGAFTDYNAQIPGGLMAAVNSHMLAIANLNGYTTAVAQLTATLSSGKIAGIRATVHNGAGGASSGSLLELLGDNVMAPGSLTVRSLTVSDFSDYMPGPDWEQPEWYIRNFGAVAYRAPTAGESGTKIARLTGGSSTSSDVSARRFKPAVEGEQYVLEYRARTSGTVTTPTVSPQYRWNALTDPGEGATSGSLQSASNVTLTSTWQTFRQEFTIPAGRLWWRPTIRFNHTAGIVEVATFRVFKKMAGRLVVDGDILGRHIAANEISVGHLNVDFLNGNRIRASYIDVDSLLQILPDAALAYGKTAISDPTPGIFFGRDTGESGSQFGFSASTSVGGREQSIALSETGGLSLKNAQFRRAAVGGWVDSIRDSNLSKQALPAGIQTLTVQVSGGGGGGQGVVQGNRTATYSTGGNGATTTVKLYDGATLKRTITATGGLGGGQSGHTYTGTKGQNNAINGSTGGAGAGSNAGTAGAGLAGGGGGGGYRYFLVADGGEGNDQYSTYAGKGGMAGQRTVVSNIDVSTWASPQIEITIGAAGAASSTPASGSGKSGAGGKGRVVYSYTAVTEFTANVVIPKPTATGTMTKTALAVTFPNFGPGFWVLSSSNNNNLDIGWVEVADDTPPIHVFNTIFASFFSAKTPVRLSGGTSANRTIHYAFHSMGDL